MIPKQPGFLRDPAILREVEGDCNQLQGVGPDPEWAEETSQPVADILALLMPRLKLAEQLRADELRRHWGEIVGEFNARHSQPDALKRGVLAVKVTNAPLRHQLEMLKGDILGRIRERFGEGLVKELRFGL